MLSPKFGRKSVTGVFDLRTWLKELRIREGQREVSRNHVRILILMKQEEQLGLPSIICEMYKPSKNQLVRIYKTVEKH